MGEAATYHVIPAMGPRVWLPQATRGHDYTPSYSYGSPAEVASPDALSIMPSQLAEFALHFKPFQDFLVLTGNPLIMAMVFSQALSRCRNVGAVLRVLKWDRMTGSYTIVSVPPDYIR